MKAIITPKKPMAICLASGHNSVESLLLINLSTAKNPA